MKTLIVYYSLEGNTDYVAKRIAGQIGADRLRLVPVKPYSKKGLKKYLRGGRSAMMAEKPKLEEYKVDLSRYDRILFGFPVWASNVAPPLRTFIAENRAKIKKKDIAAFACQGGRGAEKALAKLRKAIGVAELDVEAVFNDPKKRRSKDTDAMIDTFCRVLSEQAEEAAAEKAEEQRSFLKKSMGAVQTATKKLPEKRPSGKEVRDYFSHWNYKKHAKFCTGLYLSLYLFDMTVSYFICKKALDKVDKMRGV